MTRQDAIEFLTLLKKAVSYFEEYGHDKASMVVDCDKSSAFDMAIEALSADTVSREEYEELYHKAKEVNGMANDILADFPSYKELVSVVRCKDCRHYGIGNCYMYGGQMNEDDFCSYGERSE